MHPHDFVRKWQESTLKERSASHEHFIDLCHVLGEKTPAEADRDGLWYCFEKGARKTTGGSGWADVWKRGCFGWEYKGRKADLDDALAQLRRYAPALENPPLLIVCDTGTVRIHTNFTNTVQQIHTIELADLERPEARQLLKWAFSEPERLRPGETREAVTEKAASEFAGLAQRLRDRGHDPQRVAHFINRLLFGLFAEDIGLLPNYALTRLLQTALEHPHYFEAMAQQIFVAMRSGGVFGPEYVEWFNGGLFDSDDALPLAREDIAQLLRAADLDWGELEPSIFGTLFERGLDPDKRSQLGAHYTDRGKIMLIVEPVVLAPLRTEWERTREAIAAALARYTGAKSKAAGTRAYQQARELHYGFLERLRGFRVLDPACGSGNFLYLALLGLKDLEHRANLDAEALGLERQFPAVGPECVGGIEINPYAAELARTTVWIGEIQWMKRNGFDVSRKPILKPLDTIECRDAVLNPDGSEAEWPPADVIVGNPPFCGVKHQRSRLSEAYISNLRRNFDSRLPAVDYVGYWFEKARQKVAEGATLAVGLVTTRSIRKGSNRIILDRIVRDAKVFNCWDNKLWILDGAALRVALICFANRNHGKDVEIRLNGNLAFGILPDLSEENEVNLGLLAVSRLSQNAGVSFIGAQLSGPFDVDGEVARSWLKAPVNPNGLGNKHVLKPLIGGDDITDRNHGQWVVDFGPTMLVNEAALYESPFQFVKDHVLPVRQSENRERRRKFWWRLGEPIPGFRQANRQHCRYILTSLSGKHRLFVWQHSSCLPDSSTVAICKYDDTSFGIICSHIHTLWASRRGNNLGAGGDDRYTPTATFETFPFPDGLTPDIPAAAYTADPRAVAIAEAAKHLNDLREAWLNPPDLVRRVPEVVPGYPDRLLPVDERAAAVLKKRTLTNLYNERPTWLANAHRELDEAVAAAYGWPADMADDEILRRLFELNQERAAAQNRVPAAAD